MYITQDKLSWPGIVWFSTRLLTCYSCRLALKSWIFKGNSYDVSLNTLLKQAFPCSFKFIHSTWGADKMHFQPPNSPRIKYIKSWFRFHYDDLNKMFFSFRPLEEKELNLSHLQLHSWHDQVRRQERRPFCLQVLERCGGFDLQRGRLWQSRHKDLLP